MTIVNAVIMKFTFVYSRVAVANSSHVLVERISIYFEYFGAGPL